MILLPRSSRAGSEARLRGSGDAFCFADMLRNLSSNRESSRETCIWLIPSSSAMSDCERCSKNRSQISRRSDSSSRARARSMINRVSIRSLSSSLSLERKQTPRDIAVSMDKAL